jgi:hypothetical protein
MLIVSFFGSASDCTLIMHFEGMYRYIVSQHLNLPDE